MLTYLALGDSYTIGEGVDNKDNFPNQLANYLSKLPSSIPVAAPKIIATTGWTTNELQAGIAQQEEQEVLPKYDIVTLLIGVNNQYRNYPKEQFTKEFSQLLYKAILHCNKGNKQVFVVSIPDWGVTPFAQDRNAQEITKEIAAYNMLKKTICLMNKCTFIDITPSSIQNGSKPQYLVEDLLHYSDKEYKNWVEIIGPIIQKQLSLT